MSLGSGTPPDTEAGRTPKISPAAKAFLQRYAQALELTERASREEIAGWQAPLLSRLVTVAFRESPFYRERLSPLFWRGGEPDVRFRREAPILRATIELTYGPSDDNIELAIDNLVDQFSILIGRLITLVRDIVPILPRTPGGKFDRVVSTTTG